MPLNYTVIGPVTKRVTRNINKPPKDPKPQKGVAAPSNLVATENGASQIDLAWTDNSPNETGFSIERSANGISGWAEVGTNAADDTTFSNTGLTASTQYYYRVKAYRGSKYSQPSGVASATTQSTLINGLISWWGLEESSGNRVDSHGGYTLASTGGTGRATGKLGFAASFDGTDDFLSRAATPYALSTGTIAFWAKKDVTTSQWVFTFNGLTEFDCYNDADSLRFRVQNDTIPARGPWTATNWNHCILTWNTTTAQVYINNAIGDISSSGTYTGISGSGNFIMGERATSGQNWDGLLDEFAIWNRIITASERAALYNSGTGIRYADL